MAKYHGQGGRLYLSPDGSGAAIMIAQLTEWTLDMSRERVDATTFDDDNTTFVLGKKNAQGTFSGVWNDADDTIWDAADSTTAVKMYLYPSKDAPTKFFSGTAWVDASISASVTDAVRVTGNFVAAGSWSRA